MDANRQLVMSYVSIALSKCFWEMVYSVQSALKSPHHMVSKASSVLHLLEFLKTFFYTRISNCGQSYYPALHTKRLSNPNKSVKYTYVTLWFFIAAREFLFLRTKKKNITITWLEDLRVLGLLKFGLNWFNSRRQSNIDKAENNIRSWLTPLFTRRCADEQHSDAWLCGLCITDIALMHSYTQSNFDSYK